MTLRVRLGIFYLIIDQLRITSQNPFFLEDVGLIAVDNLEASVDGFLIRIILTYVMRMVVGGDHNVFGSDHSEDSILILKHKRLMLSPFFEMSYLEVLRFFDIIEANCLLVGIAIPV